MKKILLTACLVAAAMIVWAQDAPKNILGIRAGVNFANISMDDAFMNYVWESADKSGRTGFHVGVSEQLRLAQAPLYLETGLYFTTKGCKVTGSGTESGYTWGNEVKLNTSYLQLPVLISYHFRVAEHITLQPFAGPYIAVGISSKEKYDFWESGNDYYNYSYEHDLFKKETVTDSDGDTEEVPQFLKRGDVGLRLGLGVSFDKIYLGVGYDLGLMDISGLEKALTGGKEYAIKNNCFTITAGYNF